MKKYLTVLTFSLIFLALLPTLVLRILETRILPPTKLNLPDVTEKMLTSSITYDCQIKITTDKREFLLPTNFDNKISKCYQFALSVVSPSGKYLAYEDISGGVDSMVWLYSLKEDDRLQLDVLGTSIIKDMKFDKDDRLIVLNGYENEMAFRLYDIRGLFSGYPANVDSRYNIFEASDFVKHTRTQLLPEGEEYNFMALDEVKLYIYGSAGLSTEPSLEFLLEDI